jgi:peptide-methionine (R)-S-oxide reductase
MGDTALVGPRRGFVCNRLTQGFAMASRRVFLVSGSAAAVAAVTALFQWRGASAQAQVALLPGGPSPSAGAVFAVTHTDAQWRQMLSEEQYLVLRKEATERPYSSALNSEHRSGIFACAGCRLELFSSSTKFDSHTGWPSFWAPLQHAVATNDDTTLGMARTEVHCVRCGGHLGHVFDDGPRPTGLRYCMNGLAMTFTPGAA